jgi:hypothetical protein
VSETREQEVRDDNNVTITVTMRSVTRRRCVPIARRRAGPTKLVRRAVWWPTSKRRAPAAGGGPLVTEGTIQAGPRSGGWSPQLLSRPSASKRYETMKGAAEVTLWNALQRQSDAVPGVVPDVPNWCARLTPSRPRYWPTNGGRT